MKRLSFVILLSLISIPASPQSNLPGGPPASSEGQTCAALTDLTLEHGPGGPALITSARLIDVPATGLEEWVVHPSGYGSSAALRISLIHQYCDITDYIAPQNKFELKLPLPGDWNQKFFFHAYGGGFCGHVDRDALNLSLARGYASG